MRAKLDLTYLNERDNTRVEKLIRVASDDGSHKVLTSIYLLICCGVSTGGFVPYKFFIQGSQAMSKKGQRVIMEEEYNEIVEKDISNLK